MKQRFNNVLKVFIFLLIVLSCGHAIGQKSIYLRVYNLQGKKVFKGRVISVTDSTLQLAEKKSTTTINMHEIGHLRTKKSAGNNVLLGSTVGLTSFAIIGAATVNRNSFIFNTPAEGAVIGGFLGVQLGAIVGVLSTLFKKSKYYLIKSDPTNWKVFKEGFNSSTVIY